MIESAQVKRDYKMLRRLVIVLGARDINDFVDHDRGRRCEQFLQFAAT
jgi:hypothetical protein